MKFPKKNIISILLLSLSLLFIFILQTIPTNQIWKSYGVLYVEKSVSENDVLDLLADENCDDVISLSNQYLPFVSNVISYIPEDNSSYLERKKMYFTDRDSKYNLFYFPSEKEKAVYRIVSKLGSEKKVSCGVNSRIRFPLLCFFVSLIVYIIFTVFCDKKFFFLVSQLPVVLLSFSQPFYIVSCSSILFMTSYFLAMKIYNRKKNWNIIKKNPLILVFLFLSLLASLLISFKVFLLSALSFGSAVSFLFTYDWFESVFTHSNFTYVKIIPASRINLLSRKNIKNVYVQTAATFVLLVLFLITQKINSSKNEKLKLPMPSLQAVSSENKLPDIDDFYEWVWNITMYPYMNLNSNNNKYEIYYPRYKMNENNTIETYYDRYVYDSSFKNEVDKKLDLVDNTSLEYFLKKQGNNITVSYTDSLKSPFTTRQYIVSLILILLSVFIPVVFILCYKVIGKFRK